MQQYFVYCKKMRQRDRSLRKEPRPTSRHKISVKRRRCNRVALPQLLLAALGLFQTLGVGQNALAHTDALRGDLEQLIVGDELESRSMDIWRGGIRRSASSEPDARMLVSCFFRQTFTVMSSLLGVSPTTMPP